MRNFLNPSFSKSLISLFVSQKAKCFNNAFAKFYATVVIMLLCTTGALGQITNMKFSSATATYTEISGGTTLVAGGNVAVGNAALKSAVTPIGFTFNYQGVDYTQFSAAATGMLQFGATQVAVYDNSNILTAATPFVFASWDWYTVGTVASSGGVTSQLSGTAPNRVLTVQWKVTKTANTATTHNFQVRLYETSNKIEFHIGAGNSTSLSTSTGLNGLGAGEHLYVYTSNEALFTSMNIANTTWPSLGRQYTFTPKATPTVNGVTVGGTPNFWVKADQPLLYNRTFLNVPAANRTASSSYAGTTLYLPGQSVFSSPQAWLSTSVTYQALPPTEYITLDLGSVQTIDGIGTMGRAANTETATSFTVVVSSDNVNWTNLGLFLRNEDSKVLQYNDFDTPVTTRYVRVVPTDFVGSKALRLDLYTKSAVTPLVNNTLMTIWEDLSGNDYDAMNIDGNATRPTYLTNQFNFNPAVNFSTTSHKLNNPDFSSKSIYFVSAPSLNGVPVINTSLNPTLAQFAGVAELAESIGYQNTPTAIQEKVIKTYLATKYGTTLSHDYVAADETTKVYDLTANAGYVSNIFGIARSDSQGLHQRQSKSVNATAALTIGNNDIIDRTNGNTAASGNDLSTNNSYLMLGDNNGDLAINLTTTTNKYFFNRIWKLQETGTVGSVKVSIPAHSNSATTTLPNYLTAFYPNNKVYLAMDDDGNFQNGGTTFIETVQTGSGVTASYDVNVDLIAAKPYLAYAVDKDMTDTDSDGVVNVDDIDDDNDGVLDTDENGGIAKATYTNFPNGGTSGTGSLSNSCRTINFSIATTGGVTFNNTATTTATSSCVFDNANYVPALATSNTIGVNMAGAANATSGTMTFTFSEPVTNPLIYFSNNDHKYWDFAGTPGLYSVERMSGNTSFLVEGTKIGRLDQTTTASTNNFLVCALQPGGAGAPGYGVARLNGTFTTINVTAVGLNASTDIITFNLAIQNLDCDTDGDGIKNSIDLDSDGDGCSDAKEASSSTTASSTTAYPTGTDTNTNGLLNAYEGTTAGTVNYTSSYSMALESTTNACIDTDGDGISDVADIDDDNDGVLDNTECPTTELVSNGDFTNGATGWTLGTGWGVSGGIASNVTDGAINAQLYQTIAKPLSNNHPGFVDIKFDVRTNGSGNVINNAYVASLALKINDVQYAVFTNPANTSTATVAVENGATTSTSNFQITTTSGAFSTVVISVPSSVFTTSNTLSFSFTAPTDDFSIDNVTVSSGGSLANCDTDGDGISNNLDLDSDGDGCADAKEAGSSSTATSTTVYPTGTDTNTNGLLNAYEGTTAGTVNYTSTYANFATNNAFNACSDNDNDGVADVLDIDDDNDGILDITEQGTCTYPDNNLSDLTYTGNAPVTTTGTTINVISNANGNWKSSYSDQTLKLPIHLEYTTTSNVAYTNALIGLLPVGNTQNVTNWNDGAYKVYHNGANISLYKPQGVTTPVTTFYLTRPYTAGQKMEIDISATGMVTIKQAGVIIKKFKGRVADYKLAISAAYNVNRVFSNVHLTSWSLNGVCTDIDTDSDGVPNRFDLDSDNDGCKDHIEGGAATSNATTIPYGNVGTNGLADELENPADSGYIIYEDIYDTYAINDTIEACDDHDNDGILDYIDIDDDNDGVLDTEEQANCTVPNVVLDDLTWTGNSTVSAFETTVSGIATSGAANTGGWTSSYANEELELPIHLEFTTATNMIEGMIGLIPATAAQPANVWNDVNSYKYYFALSTNYYGKFPLTTWNIPSTGYTAAQKFELDINEQGVLTATVNGVMMHRIQAPVSAYKFVVSGKSAEKQFDNVVLVAKSSNTICEDIDTDGDGVPNRLDLDSDEDGCNDAVEAGVGNVSTTVPLTGAVGANGLVDTKETAVDNGRINYSSTYDFYGVSETENVCLDSDGDSIGNLTDIDDDNDGVLDAIEMGCSVPLFVNKTTENTTTSKKLTGTIIKETGNVDYEIAMSGAGVSNPGVYDGGNGIHFRVDGVTNALYLNLKLTAAAAENSSTTSPPKVRTVDFGPSVPLNTATGSTINETNNITLNWPGAYAVVYDPNNQLSSHNTGDIIKSGDILIQNVAITAAQIAAGQTWKVKMYMHTTADVYDIKATVFGDAALGAEAYGFNTQVCAPADTDADGLPNHLDTDADGDGCYDAYESSSVTSSSQETVAGPYGNNGFASSLETNDNFDAGMTTAFSNTISYNQAISSAINSCSDTDGDGIKDSEDIDDDNDGIVDADEMSCGVAYFTMPTLTTGATANLQNLTGTASLGNAGIDYEMNLVGVNTVFTNATTNTQFDNSKDGIHYAFTDNDNVYSQTYKLAPSAPTLIKKVRFGVNVPTNQITTTQVNDAQSIVLTWSPDVKAVVYDPNDQLSTHATGDVITSGTTITTRANYTIAASTWKIEFLANGLAREFYLQTTHKTTSSTNVGVEGYGLSADICFVNDTDGDGISDHLDTDSDDDGCGDAYESGATSTPGGATQTIAGPYGTNGLANSLETNDTQDASTTYASTAYMAYSPVSACADTDNDGIPDRDDIDDDNDGILDATEYGCGVGKFVQSYVITSGLGMGYGGSFNNGNSKGTGTMSFTDLSSVTTVSDVTDASNYKVNDANTTYKFKASIAPTNGIISQLAFGPNLPGNTANAAVVNGQQSITLSWNFPVGGIVYDPDNQLSSHTDGQGINPGDVITTSANYAVSASTWKVVIPFNYINKQVDFTAQFVGVANLGDESFGISTNICNKVTDVDGDKKANAVDTDSDGDGCYDLVESNSGYYTSLTQETIVGPYGVNGYSATAETNDTLLANANYTTSSNYLNNTIKGCLDTDGDGVSNVNDIDDDNDGILDQTECPVTPPVTKFGFQQIAGTNGRQMYITNKTTNVPIGKITIAPVKNIGVDTLVGNENDNSVSGHWVDGASANSADRVMTIKFEPVAPYTSLDLKVLATEGGNGTWGFHPRSLRVDGGIAGDGVIKAIPQRYYLREKYTVGQTITSSMRISTAFSGMLSGSSNKVFIQVQYNAQATAAAPLTLKYTWNALAGSVYNENFGFQLLELNPSLTTGPCDYDNDGIFDDLDSDSDNDGCPDTKEAVHGKPYASDANYIKGPYGVNGFSTLVETNDSLGADYSNTGWLPKVTTSPKKDYVNELINTRCIIPFIAPAGPTTFCSPGSVILNINLNGGATPTAYQWKKNGVDIAGATANTYTATETGDYTVLLTYADTSTVLTDPQDVTVNPTPAVPTVTVVPGTTVCLGSTATLTSSYATNNQWYQNNAAIAGATAQAYTAATSGDYKVEYTDPVTGCKSDSTTSIIVVSTLPLAPVVATTQPTCSVATGTITITPSGNAGETYSINGTTYQVSNVFTGLAAGTYTVTTKNSNGCTSEVTSAVINAQPAASTVPTITAAPGTAICSGGATTLTASTSTAYQWFKDGVAIVGATNATYTANEAGSYTVIGTVASGCSATSTATVVTIAPAPTASIAQSITLGNSNCGTSAPVLLTATTDASSPTYIWYKDGSEITGETTATYTAVLTGSYTVKITSAAGCSFTSTPSVVTTGPSVNVTSGSVCSGQTFTFTATTTGFTNPTFAWEFSADGTTGWASASGANTAINYVASVAGFYRVIVADGSQTITSCPSELILFALPTASISANPTGALCDGQSTVLTATGTVTSPTTVANYQWLDGTTPISGATTATYTSTLSGSYSVIITDSNGCQVTTAPTTVTVNPLAATPVATVTGPSCSVTTGTITVSAPTGTGYTYTVDGGTAQSSPVFSGLAVGSHTIIAISPSGCASASVSETIPVAPGALTISGTISGNATPYLATSETYSVTAVTGAVSYIWTLPNGWTGTSTSNTIIATTAAMTNNTGTITVKAVNAAGCESAPVTLNVAIKPHVLVPPAVTNYVYCQNATATAVTATPDAGGTLNWYAAATGATTPSSLIPSTTTAGTFSYYVSQTVDGVESDRTEVQVVVNPAPATALSTVTQPSCSVSTGTIFVDSPRGSGLTYSIDGTNYTNTTGQFTNLTAGTYSITTQSASGCVSAASSVTITSFPSSIASAVATLVQPTCNVSTGTITVTSPIQAGLTYSIDGFDYSNTNGIFNNVAPGTYPITIKNMAGCVNTASNVTINTAAALPTAPAATITQPSCTVATGTITITSPVGSGITYSIDGSNYTNTTGVFAGLTPGIYTISAQGAVGCIGNSTSFVVNSQPATPTTPTVSVVNPSCSVSTGTITVVSPLGTGNTYSTDGTTYTNTIGIFTGLTAATYNVTVKNGSGCTSAATVATIASQSAAPSAPTVSVTQPICTTATGTITVTSTITTGDHFSIDGATYTNTTGIFTGVTSGNYSVTVKSAAGCISPLTSIVVNAQPATPVAPVVTTVQPSCTVATATITVTSPTGIGFTYSSDGTNYTNTTGIFANLTSGNYSITAKNTDGCSGLSTTITIISQTSLICDTDGDGVDDAQETIDNTDPNDFCDYNPTNQTSAPSTAWNTADCDGDGTPNGSDTKPLDPCVNNGTSTPDTTNTIWAAADCDNDGIPNAIDGLIDTDGDGIPNYKDLDSDGDGIPDAVEKGPNGSTPIDTDGDGTPDFKDLDSDNDGIPDATEDSGCTGTAPCTPTDTDGDGTPDYRDLDSDGDGVLDSVDQCPLVVGTVAANGCPADYDGDGIDDIIDLDDDNDGILDTVEAAACSPTDPNCDTDGDGIPNRLDSDSDNDGISDVKEAGGTDSNNDGKVDGGVDANGVPSSTNGGLTPPNTDGTGESNPYDLDSDGDGISDAIEKGANGNSPVDTDGDGTPDYLDLDSDGDGISDAIEKGPNGSTPLDTDGDGTPDYRDLDSDGDGISDAIEKGANGNSPVDTDGDGTPDYLDLDSDGDGISDAIEKGTGATPVDTDGDGIADYKDLDSDNDGIPDAIEKGTGTTPIDTDGDGTPDYRDLDSDNDGILDSVEKGTGTTPVDTDGDGTPDYQDLDSDNDGILDAVEKGTGTTPVDTDGDGTPDYQDLDSDNDGILDAVEKGTGTTPVDTDGDGTPDYQDLDSDNDGITDAIEKGPGTTPVDTDGDGTPDYRDLDSDNDGITDSIEKGPGVAPLDTDGDGTPDYRDLDSDNDGILDSIEKGTGANPLDTDGDGTPDYRDLDSDGDGKPDAQEGNIDTDGDGTPNFQDLDSDGDGVLDSVDQCPLIVGTVAANGCPADYDGDGIDDIIDLDDDNDGILDTVEAVACSPTDPNCDTDGDGIPNRLDSDSDNDGISDVKEAGGTDSNNDGKVDGGVDANGVPSSTNGGLTPPNTDGTGESNPYDLDSDGDGISDAIEKGANGNSPVDTDGDGTPDYLDLDSDGDGISDAIEKGPNGSTPLDTDGDGTPDYRDLDSDNDGITDAIEKGTGTTPIDTDGDGTPDYRDLDSDNDGILDSVEKGTGTTPVDTDGDGTPDYQDLDSDNDGILDSVEKGPGTTPVDTDGDGTPDYQDLDSDNDGILDSVEKGPGTTPVDTDGDGTPDYQDLDSDNDGILDSVEKGTGTTPVDTDGDGTPDYRDLDSDNDGILDSVEKGTGTTPIDTDGDGTPDYQDLDSDNDGLPDNQEGVVDTDSDGIPDYRDLDSDGDGILDTNDICPLVVGTVLMNGCPADFDGDGIPDTNDLDDDNDGILDTVEAAACSPVDPNCDTDGDGIPNRYDADSDNDGIKDTKESGVIDADNDGKADGGVDVNGVPSSTNGGLTPPNTDGTGESNPYDLDSDGDGISDTIEKGANGANPVDTDADGTPDYLDLDSDNDGIPDAVEKGSGSSILDTDGDGTPDYRDLDSDNDGIPDAVEKGANGATPVDTDGDGTPDYRDLDSDNDGILDSVEKGPGATPIDTDGDGTPDYQDLDSDNDGITDAIEKGTGTTPVDTDGDGTPDYRDLDSDNDGIPDAVEKGVNVATPVDTDGDGTPDYRDLDSDNDGIPDTVEKGANGVTPVDTDGDGTPDYQDLDSDGDGIPDAVEKGNDPLHPVDTDNDGTPDYRDLDSDNDGIPDSVEKGPNGATPVDTDGDGTPDYRDLDSDNDGILDSVEKGANGATPVDTDGDGTPDYRDLDSDADNKPDNQEGLTDTDGDGLPNYRDIDSDNDGVLDINDQCPYVEGTVVLNGCPPDSDSDGLTDNLDLDDDNDGILDTVENGICTPASTNCDTDGDGIPNRLDPDSDNDGISDVRETNGIDINGDGKVDGPVDSNGIPQSSNGGVTPPNTDGDANPNPYDVDSDGDGISDAIEKGANGNAPVDTDGDGTPDYLDLDSDNDGIPDNVEKGTGTSILDTDGDGTPDYQDLDSDNDGIPDAVEKGPNGATPIDTDGDGTPDYRDLDSDNDGILDTVEKGPNGNAPIDTDGDGTPDYRDIDSDGDGVRDFIDNCPLTFGNSALHGCPGIDSDNDGIPDAVDLDDDNDGITDVVENAACSPSVTNCDTDGDGIINSLDLDSDNDGITDARESNGTDADGDGRIDGAVDANGVPISANGGVTPPDTDGDGKRNPYDVDSDGDGIPDSVEKGATPNAPVDTDGDGTPDYLDLDSDGDGIPDSVEKGPNGATPLDTDNDGTPDYRDLDSDGDGIPDAVEKGPNGATPIDTDNDGTPDYRDLDSDNDGIPDSVEKGSNGATPIDTDNDGTPDYRDLDSDGDGIPDSVEKGPNGATPIDTDNDGTPDYRDLDSDGDGIPDSVEKGPNGATPIDTDNDGTPDYRDLDSDGDGIPDSVEKGPNGATPIDTDNDGTPDYRDLDSDNDGIPDSVEKGPNGAIPVDTDGDGMPDYRDLDSDADGVLDSQERLDGTNPLDPCDSVSAHRTLPVGNGFLSEDCDGDGLSNEEEIGSNPAKPQDNDKNGVSDYLEKTAYIDQPGEIEIYNSVSPNGDGDNDVFVIRNIENFPNNTVTIFNRWGVKVFELDGYGQTDKMFRGVSEGRVTVQQGEELPEGTYFYILRYVNTAGAEKQRSGYLYIKR